MDYNTSSTVILTCFFLKPMQPLTFMPSILSKESTIANRPQWYLTYNITGRIVPLVQNGQPMRHDGADNRLIEVKIKYEGISGKYDSKFQLNENEFFQLDDLSGYSRGIISVLVYL